MMTVSFVSLYRRGSPRRRWFAVFDLGDKKANERAALEHALQYRARIATYA